MKSANSTNRPALAKRAANRRLWLAAPLLLVALACGLLAGELARASAASQDAGQKAGASAAAATGKGAGRTRAARPDAAAKPAGVKTRGAVPLDDAIGCATNPQPITIGGGTVNGTLANGDCRNPFDDTFYDAYTFQGAAGQLVIISMNAPAGGIDPYLYLLVPGETTLSYRTIQLDDIDPDDPDVPNDTVDINSLLVVVLPVTGQYTIIANLFPPTQANPNRPTTGSYQLSVTGGGAACTATPIGNQQVNGTLAAGDCRLPDNSLVDVYSFTASAGQQVSVEMNSTVFDSFLFLLSTDGFTELARNDDGLTGGGDFFNQRGARIPAPSSGPGAGQATLPAAGTYYILAKPFAPEQSGAYALVLNVGANCPTQAISAGQSVNGSLTTGDCRLPLDGSFLDVYTFEGTAGQQINVTMTTTSAGLNPFLLLYDPAGFFLYEDNNGAGGTNARVPHPDDGQFLTLPVNGTYRIYANSAAPDQTGSYTLTVGSSSVNCTVTLAQTSRQNVPAAGGQFTDNFTVPAGCAAPAVSTGSAFITNLSATVNSQGQGSFTYTVAQNGTGQSRSGTISVGGQTFTVQQQAGCAVGLSPTIAPFAQGGGAGRFTVVPENNNAQCAWTAATTANWIAINTGATGAGTNRVTYTVAANNTGSTRTGAITVNGQTHTVTQLAGAAPTVAFNSATFSANEEDASRSITVTVSRSGDVGGASTVEYRTAAETDAQTQIPCNPTQTPARGSASPRCDFATTIDTLTFAATEVTKTFTIPLINDVHVEGAETFQVELADPRGAALGAQSTATVTINDDDTTQPTQNPVRPPLPYGPETARYFVRMQYLDFLSREPEQGEPWTAVLANCPNPENRPEQTTTPSAGCDRLLVSQSFFESEENRIKGRFVFLHHKASFGSAADPNYYPEYRDFVIDLRRVTGQTAAETIAKRLDFSEDWVLRPGFAARYNGKSNDQFVDELLANVNSTGALTQARSGFTRDSLLADLNAGTKTRAEVLRLIVESPEVSDRQFNHAYVAMQYYNYLRRTPELSGYLSWLNAINQNRQNLRVMVDGFVNSTEYMFRFGPS
jgi:hypothetical protein